VRKVRRAYGGAGLSLHVEADEIEIERSGVFPVVSLSAEAPTGELVTLTLTDHAVRKLRRVFRDATKGRGGAAHYELDETIVLDGCVQVSTRRKTS
jgi:hypothetical protein